MSRRLRTGALLVALIVLFSPQAPAQATTYSADSFRFIGLRCSWGWHEITNEWGYPGMQSIGTMDRSYAGYCDDKAWQADPYTIRIRQDLITWHPDGYPYRCNAGPWVYNTAKAHAVGTWFAWGSPPCGSNRVWYRADGYAAIWWDGRWQGGEKAPLATNWVYTP